MSPAPRLAGESLDLLDCELGGVAADLLQLRLARARLLVQRAGEARSAAGRCQLLVAGRHLGRCRGRVRVDDILVITVQVIGRNIAAPGFSLSGDALAV